MTDVSVDSNPDPDPTLHFDGGILGSSGPRWTRRVGSPYRLSAMKRVLVVLVLSGLLVACSSDDDGGSSESASCSTVKNPTLLETIKASDAEAVRAGTDGYFVATAGGATWFTTAEVDEDDSGLVLPLNDAARAASDAGADVPAGAPVFKGRTDDDPGARVVRSCV